MRCRFSVVKILTWREIGSQAVFQRMNTTEASEVTKSLCDLRILLIHYEQSYPYFYKV